MSEETTQEQTTAEAQPNLSLQDLLLVVQIVQIATQRGAFRAEELSNIGGLYDRLVTFLNATGAIKPAEQGEATPASEGN